MSPLAKPGGNVNPPYPTNVVWPDNMPHNARPTHIVLISLVVGVDGKVHDARVVQSRGKDSDEKALEAVRKWVFRPATKDGHKVAVTVQVEVPSR
jgi:TonB family protein